MFKQIDLKKECVQQRSMFKNANTQMLVKQCNLSDSNTQIKCWQQMSSKKF